MNHRYKVSAGAVSILLVFFFIFSALYIDNLYIDKTEVSGTILGQTSGSNSWMDVNKFHLQNIDAGDEAVLDGGMAKSRQETMPEWCGGRQRVRTLSAGLFTAALLWLRRLFFTGEHGRFFVFFQADMFCQTRALCELFIRQRKDGKKRFSAI